MCDHLEACFTGQIRRLIILVPPRHQKSITASVMMPTWAWTFRPEYKFLYCAYALTLSIRDALKSRRLIQSNWYQDRWGEKFHLTGDQNAKVRYENDHTGYRIASSVGGTNTGEGGDFTVVDDPHNLKDIHSDIIRESAIDWWDTVMPTRLNDMKTGVRIIIMQRGHQNDLAGHAMKQGGWEVLSLPAEYEGSKKKTIIGWKDPRTKAGELLNPGRFGPKEIAELKIQLGSDYNISCQLQQRPSPKEGNIFKAKHFRLWPKDKPIPPLHFVVQSYDTAFTEKTENDPTCCTVWGIFKHKLIYNALLLDAWEEYLEYPELRRRVKLDLKAKYGDKGNERAVDEVIIENKGSGITLIQDLRMIKVKAFPYNPNKADKVVRAHASTPFCAAGVVWMLESNSSTKEHPRVVSWSQPVLDELLSFGPGAEKDNFVDTWTQTAQYLRDHGLLEARVFGEEGDDVEPEDYHRETKEPIYG